MTQGHRAIERDELITLQDPHIGEFGDEPGDRIVELPFALFIEEHHRDADDRLCHRGDTEDGVFAQLLASIKRLMPITLELHELAVARDHDAYPGIVTGIDLRLHRAVETVETLGGEPKLSGKNGNWDPHAVLIAPLITTASSSGSFLNEALII
jgi:hypothetical protein